MNTKKKDKVENKEVEKKIESKKISTFKKKKENFKEHYVWCSLCLLYI